MFVTIKMELYVGKQLAGAVSVNNSNMALISRVPQPISESEQNKIRRGMDVVEKLWAARGPCRESKEITVSCQHVAGIDSYIINKVNNNKPIPGRNWLTDLSFEFLDTHIRKRANLQKL